MKIELSGYNVESNLLDQLPEKEKLKATPEIFSAAYARISRSSLDVTSLRKKAREDIKKARASNEKIIFSMGHHSVAEHAVFNFDIIGVSRLALEDIEKLRLSSFTEKSQRYVTLKGDYYFPPELDDKQLASQFRETVTAQNNFYLEIFEKLKNNLLEKHKGETQDKSRRNIIAGWAKEDARYILSLATLGQVGLTINARNLEHLLRRFSISPRIETKKIGEKLFAEVRSIAPSIILFRNASPFEEELNKFSEQFPDSNKSEDISLFKLIDYPKNGDDLILASFLSQFKAISFKSALKQITSTDIEKKRSLFKKLFSKLEFFDSPPRNFELPYITFEAVISASNYAQLKRHRMATLLCGSYDPEFGNTIPVSVSELGFEKRFIDLINMTNETYGNIKKKYNITADYILTNSHRRNVIMKMNMREIFHFVRLRSDNHAQWDIKNLSNLLLKEIKKIMPLSSMLLCGKDSYSDLFESVYKKKPDYFI